jgi:hypothetical protein
MPATSPAEIATELARVRALVRGGRNNALAHSWIDEMYVQVLQAIADGAPEPATLAAEALLAEQIHFQRQFD